MIPEKYIKDLFSDFYSRVSPEGNDCYVYLFGKMKQKRVPDRQHYTEVKNSHIYRIIKIQTKGCVGTSSYISDEPLMYLSVL